MKIRYHTIVMAAGIVWVCIGLVVVIASLAGAVRDASSFVLTVVGVGSIAMLIACGMKYYATEIERLKAQIQNQSTAEPGGRPNAA